VSVAAW